MDYGSCRRERLYYANDKRNDYTKEEVLFGFKQLLEKSGYKDLIRLIGRVDEEER